MLALRAFPASPVPASPTPYAPDSPSYMLAPASANACSNQRGGEGRARLLVSLVTNEPTYNWQPPLPPPPGAKPAAMSYPPIATHSRVSLQGLSPGR